MVTRFQFNTVKNLLASGVTNCIQIRQQAGLTSVDLEDILENYDYYAKKFEEEERLEKVRKLEDKKKPWWKRN